MSLQVRDDESAQRQTVDEVRAIGTAMMAWLTDQTSAGAAGQRQRPGPERKVGTVDMGWLNDGAEQGFEPMEPSLKSRDLADYSEISFADLKATLVPLYAPRLPELDGWGHPYQFFMDRTLPFGEKVFCVRSPGRDGRFSGLLYSAGPFDSESFDEDIVWVDGYFVRWPEEMNG